MARSRTDFHGEGGMMAVTLQQILGQSAIEEAVARFKDAPVHFMENVNNDPYVVRTLCRKHQWVHPSGKLLDPNREVIYSVTCQGCLEALVKLNRVG